MKSTTKSPIPQAYSLSLKNVSIEILYPERILRDKEPSSKWPDESAVKQGIDSVGAFVRAYPYTPLFSSISLKYGVLPMFKELKNESLVEPSSKNNTTRFEGISSSDNSGECGVIPYEIENL